MKTSTTSKTATKEKLSFYITYGKDNLLISYGKDNVPSKIRLLVKKDLEYYKYALGEVGTIKIEKCSNELYSYFNSNYSKYSFFEKDNYFSDVYPSKITTIAEKKSDGVWELKSVIQKQKQNAILEKDIRNVEEQEFLELTSEQKSLFLFRELSTLAFKTESLEDNKQDKDNY